MNKCLASQHTTRGLNLLIDGKEYLTDGAPNFWRVCAGFDADGNPVNDGAILCLKCNEIVDPRLKDLKDLVLCKCAECGTYSIEDTLSGGS